jgi:CheY-like chemotaxis protein
LNGKADLKGRAVTLSGLKADFAIKHPAKLLLSDESYDVRCASNGIEALERVKQRVPDLLVTDWMMPLMGGAELCRRLRAQPNLARVPILANTSVSRPTNEGNAWNAYSQKPAPMQLFLTTVGRLCAQLR